MIAARSSGWISSSEGSRAGWAVTGSPLIMEKSSRQMITSRRSTAFCRTLCCSLRETKRTFVSECLRMCLISLSEKSGSIGTLMPPKAVVAKYATPQLGMFWDRSPTREPLPTP